MPIKINFDNDYKAIEPVFVLAHRNGDKIGTVKATNIGIKSTLNYFELAFSVNKFDNGDECPLWDELIDFKLLWCKDWDQWFEIHVEIDEDNDLIKNISAKSLGASELSQVNIYDIEINTETDIERDDYKPTILFNELDPEASLLNRISEKIPHYSIEHVDSSIAKVQRTFALNNVSIYDALQDIAKELECIFIIDTSSNEDGSIKRTISAYDLNPFCRDCGKRLERSAVKCDNPSCKSDNINEGFGCFTNIFISSDNLADKITYDTDEGAVKNCFKLVAGDDLMTAIIKSCNPNGSSYIWCLSKDIRQDMSDELNAQIDRYDELYKYYKDEHQVKLEGDIIEGYKTLAERSGKTEEIEAVESDEYDNGFIGGFASKIAASYLFSKNVVGESYIYDQNMMFSPPPQLSIKSSGGETQVTISGKKIYGLEDDQYIYFSFSDFETSGVPTIANITCKSTSIENVEGYTTPGSHWLYDNVTGRYTHLGAVFAHSTTTIYLCLKYVKGASYTFTFLGTFPNNLKARTSRIRWDDDRIVDTSDKISLTSIKRIYSGGEQSLSSGIYSDAWNLGRGGSVAYYNKQVYAMSSPTELLRISGFYGHTDSYLRLEFADIKPNIVWLKATNETIDSSVIPNKGNGFVACAVAHDESNGNVVFIKNSDIPKECWESNYIYIGFSRFNISEKYTETGKSRLRDGRCRCRLDCSGFVGLVIRGITYERSPFAIAHEITTSGTEAIDHNGEPIPAIVWSASDSRWGLDSGNLCGSQGWEFHNELDHQTDSYPHNDKLNDLGLSNGVIKYKTIRTAAEMGRYFNEVSADAYTVCDTGLGLDHPRGIYDTISWDESTQQAILNRGGYLCERLQPGDLVFWSKKVGANGFDDESNGEDGEFVDPDRYRKISHVGIVAEKTDRYYHSTTPNGLYYSKFDKSHIKWITMIIRPYYRKRAIAKRNNIGGFIKERFNILSYPPRWSTYQTSTYGGITYTIIDKNKINIKYGTEANAEPELSNFSRNYRGGTTINGRLVKDGVLRLLPGKYKISSPNMRAELRSEKEKKFTGDGVTQSFILDDKPFSENVLSVTVSGEDKTYNYNAENGLLTFNVAPKDKAKVVIKYKGSIATEGFAVQVKHIDGSEIAPLSPSGETKIRAYDGHDCEFVISEVTDLRVCIWTNNINYYIDQTIEPILIAEELYTSATQFKKRATYYLTGYDSLVKKYYDANEVVYYLSHEQMPTVSTSSTSAEKELGKLSRNALNPIAVSNLSTCSQASVNSAVLSMAKVFVDPRYQIKIESGEYDLTTHIWSGTFSIINYSDEDDVATSSGEISLSIIDGKNELKKYTHQKMQQSLVRSNNVETQATDIVSLFNLIEKEEPDGEQLYTFKNELKKYGLVPLQSIYDSCQSCIDIMIQQGISDKKNQKLYNDTYTHLYTPYYNALIAIESELKNREGEVSYVTTVMNMMEEERLSIQEVLNFEQFLKDSSADGESLWLEFCMYRRDDVYENKNYISDGLTNADLILKAQEFINAAQKEAYKSATYQHSITADLKDLLVMDEFRPIVNSFEVGNWIQFRVDNHIYRLRLIEYKISFGNIDRIEVAFSDVMTVASGINDLESLLNKTSTMATSYGAVAYQAEQGKNAASRIDDWLKKGLDLTKLKILDNADNQNISWDEHGILCKEYLPITDTYDSRQLKIINRGLYLTDDNWETSRAGVGDFIFYNPKEGHQQYEESYGIIADTLVGNLILSEEVGIYNENNSITLDKNGLVITVDQTVDKADRAVFKIRKKLTGTESTSGDGEDISYQTEDVIFFDDDGNANFHGKVTASELYIGDSKQDIDSYLNSTRTNIFRQGEDPNKQEGVFLKVGDLWVNTSNNGAISYWNGEAWVGTNGDLEGLNQFMKFNPAIGLIIGQEDSSFKTIISNTSLRFTQDSDDVAYIQEQQLFVEDAVIRSSMKIGNFEFRKHDDNNGFYIVYVKDDYNK